MIGNKSIGLGKIIEKKEKLITHFKKYHTQSN